MTTPASTTTARYEKGTDVVSTEVRDEPRSEASSAPVAAGAFNGGRLVASFPDALRKLDPRVQLGNPVMFVVWVGSALVTGLAIVDPSVFAVLIAVWLWLTVIFANLAEAVAEGRGKAQAESLRATKRDTTARRLRADGGEEQVPGIELTIGDLVVVEANETIPGDGDVVEGIATVDESAITGESAPVIREARGAPQAGTPP
ncbi:MAG: potassium-transporting ATPase subunit B, partial [Pseudonocardia sp.]|nr:potassium-transporting ATPase subunit B [Pseudonocardia sp.]